MKYLLNIFLLFLVTAVPLQAQDKKQLKSAREAELPAAYQVMLDSAEYYKISDIDRSIDFIAAALSSLPEQGRDKERALTLTSLGEIYQIHRQYDLAIANYRDAQKLYQTTSTAIKLGSALNESSFFNEAITVLTPLLDISGMVPFQRIQLYEYLGDAEAGSGQLPQAISYYQEGLKIAEKNRVAPKIPDLNSKIADAYAKADRLQEAEAYYGYSLEQAASQPPRRAVREKEKVADFYNRENRYEDEIELRKKSLSELENIQPSATARGMAIEDDSITTQQINYKIANAYLAQEKIDEAIPFLVESIREAGDEDLEVKKDATRQLSEAYREKGDFTRAFETYQEYVAVVDTLYLQKEEEIRLAAQFSREIAESQNRINSLERERQLSESKLELARTQQQLVEESNRRQKWVIYSLLLLMMMLALAVFFFYRSNRQQKLANHLLALKSLRTQMNPHFIFNALNSVNSYIAKSDERSANRYLNDFSGLMRAVLENSEEDFIPLQSEIDLIQLYLKLEHARFPDKFDYEFEIEDGLDVGAYQIPPMILQPYVENAVWHGLRYSEDKGLLKISLQQKSEDELEISISDTGIGRRRSAELKTKQQKKQKSTGMHNIKKRIAILNSMGKNKIDVRVEDLEKDGTGTLVRIIIKK